MNEQMTFKGWAARDKNGDLWLYLDKKPILSYDVWTSDGSEYINLDNDQFPSVKWEDNEPTEIEITIKLKQQ